MSARQYMGMGMNAVRGECCPVNANYKHWTYVCPHHGRAFLENLPITAAIGASVVGSAQHPPSQVLRIAIDNHSHCDL